MSKVTVQYIPGDYKMICDMCGYQYRKSQMRQRWDGAYVCPKDWEPRHPQDLVRAKEDVQRVDPVRPEPEDYFLEDGEVTIDDL